MDLYRKGISENSSILQSITMCGSEVSTKYKINEKPDYLHSYKGNYPQRETS